MSFIDHFFGLDASDLVPEKQLERRLRQLSIRATHTGVLPHWSDTPDSSKLAELLIHHGLQVSNVNVNEVIAKQFHGREYSFSWREGKWHYFPLKDPISGLVETRRTKTQTISLFDSLLDTSPRAPNSVWWDGKTPLAGDYLGFDLETTLRWAGEFPAIVLGSAATETGDGVLLLPEQLVSFFRIQNEAFPKQVWCGWNIAEFDIPVMDYRIPYFREQIHDMLMERLVNGYLYDTLKFVQLLDIGMYGDVFSRSNQMLFPVLWGDGWGNKVYALGPQSKRWLGIDLPKEEQQTFWEYLGRPKEITTDQAAYAIADSYVSARIQKILNDFPAVRRIARQAQQQMEVIDGVRLTAPDPEQHADLHLANGCKFGWQTHTIQFMGAYSLSWVSVNGITVDVDYIFQLINELDADIAKLLRRFAGMPGRLIYKVDIKQNKEREFEWLPEEEDAEERLRVLNDKESTTEIRFRLGQVERLQVVGKVFNPEIGQYVDRKYEFTDGKSIKKKAVAEYVSNNLWATLSSTLGIEQMRKFEGPEALGLKQDHWTYLYGVNDISDIPDTVLRLNFQIAEVMKNIATVKTYLPGLCEHEDKDRLQKKMTTRDLRVMLDLQERQRGRVYPSYRTLLATGRTGSRDPNAQQVKRDNKYRNCFVSWPEFFLLCCDYGAAEMGTQGEIYVHRYGKRVLVRYMNDGFDVHLLTAMQFRFPTKHDTWMKILGDEDCRAMKRALSLSDKEKIGGRLKARFDWFKAKYTDSGEDIAKDVWVQWLATELLPDIPLPKAKRSIKDARQAAKPVNFGVPGGMNPPRIQHLAKTDYGIDMSLADAKAAYAAWLKLYPEGRLWIVDGKQHLVKKPIWPFAPYYDNCFTLTGRLRGYRVAGTAKYDGGLNEWHNTQFQGLAADAAKIALYLTWREGLRQVNFVHDEIDFEIPKALVESQRELAANRMRQGMDNVVSHVQITVGASVDEKWQK